MTNRTKIARFADRLVKLADDYREDVAGVVEDIKKADLDVSAVRRLAAWSRKDPVKRAEQEAIDHQYRFLSGDVETPAALPDEGKLSEAAKMYAAKCSVRQVAGVLKISTGQAFKLKALAELFTVHVHEDVNTPQEYTAGSGQGAVGSSQPPNDAPQARRIEEPPAQPEAAPEAVAGAITQSAAPTEPPIESCGVGESRPEGHDLSDPERSNAEAARTAGVAPGPQDHPSPESMRSGDGASQAERPDTLDCGLTAPSASSGNPEREARSPTTKCETVAEEVERPAPSSARVATINRDDGLGIPDFLRGTRVTG